MRIQLGGYRVLAGAYVEWADLHPRYIQEVGSASFDIVRATLFLKPYAGGFDLHVALFGFAFCLLVEHEETLAAYLRTNADEAERPA